MIERPMHRLDCPCALCVRPTEATWRHLLGVAVLIGAAVLALVLL